MRDFFLNTILENNTKNKFASYQNDHLKHEHFPS